MFTRSYFHYYSVYSIFWNPDRGQTFGGSDEEVAREMIELREGGFAMVGSTNSIDGDFIDRSSNDWDLFLIEMDQQGEVTWKKTYGGSADDFGFPC